MTKIDKNKKTIEAYDKNPDFYSERFDSYGMRIEDVDRALKLNESGSSTVLELGCGTGRDAQYIISKVGIDNYVGIDGSKGLIKLAQKKNPGAMFKVEDIRKMEVSPETVGVIFAFSFFVHINREDMAEIMDKCYKTLKKGGIFYIFSSKYGDYSEKLTNNLGDDKYYYFYTLEDFEKLCPYKFFVIYKNILDLRGQKGFELILRKI